MTLIVSSDPCINVFAVVGEEQTVVVDNELGARTWISFYRVNFAVNQTIQAFWNANIGTVTTMTMIMNPSAYTERSKVKESGGLSVKVVEPLNGTLMVHWP